MNYTVKDFVPKDRFGLDDFLFWLSIGAIGVGLFMITLFYIAMLAPTDNWS